MEIKNNIQSFFYKLYGLNIKSDFYLSELSNNIYKPLDNIDIEIINGICPENIPNIKASDYYYTISDNEAIFEPKECGKFYISNGNKIIIEPIENSNYEHLKSYLLSRSFAILLFQRNMVALHGSTILFDNKAYTFCGHSGAGKSSLGAALCMEGYKMLSDDLSVISFKDDKPYIEPGFAQHKLCNDTVEYFKINNENLNKVDYIANKFSIPVTSKFQSNTSPLSVIIELSLSHDINNTEVTLKEVLGQEKLYTIFRNIFATRMMTDVGLNPKYLKQCLSIASNIKVFKLTRPKGIFTLDEQIDLVKKIRD
ncbi:MAG: hypothetical protein RSD47_08815 [Romboutsia sp.]